MPLSEKSTGIRLSANCLPNTAFAADKSEPSPDVILTLFVISYESEGNIRVGKGKSVDRRRYEIALGYVFFEEFKSCGSVVEKLLYHDSRADGTAAGFVLLSSPPSIM